MSANNAAIFLADHLHYCIEHFIPSRAIGNSSSSHPWFNERCRAAVQRKNAAFESSDFGVVARDCSHTLLQEPAAYVERIKLKFKSLKRGSKK